MVLIRHNLKKHGQLRIQIKSQHLFQSSYECNSSVCCGYHVRVVTMEVTGKIYTHRYIQHAHTTHVYMCMQIHTHDKYHSPVQIEVTCVDNHDIYKGGLN